MKIKTITCHQVYNPGASLQEFALLAFLQQQGFEAEAVQYKPPYLSQHFNIWAVSNPKLDRPVLRQLYLLAKLPGRILALKKKRNYDAFHKKYIQTTSKKYTSNEELKNDPPVADVYICGSDQIWNPIFNNGKDPAFYLDFVPEGKKKISYAASFATAEIPENVQPFVKEMVSKLDAVSVRETSAVQLLENLVINGSVQVMDPVFLHPASFWKHEMVSTIEDDFIFVCDFDSNQELKMIAKKIALQNGWKIYTTNQNIDYADQNFWKEGPQKFISLLYHSRMVLTNSFHALAFSLIFCKDFRVFLRNEAINTRLEDLLKLAGLEDRMTEDSNLMVSEDRFNEAKLRLEKQIEFSKKFLKDNLKL